MLSKNRIFFLASSLIFALTIFYSVYIAIQLNKESAFDTTKEIEEVTLPRIDLQGYQNLQQKIGTTQVNQSSEELAENEVNESNQGLPRARPASQVAPPIVE